MTAPKRPTPKYTHAATVALTTFGLALGILGCQPPDAAPRRPLTRAWEHAPEPNHASTAPTTRPASTDTNKQPAAAAPSTSLPPIIADVNNAPISRAELVDTLIETHGLDVFEKLVITTVVRQRAAELGITISQSDVDAEYDDALRRIAAPLAGVRDGDEPPADFDRDAAERVLSQFLEAKNVSRAEFRMRMRQNAYLRKIAAAEVTVRDDELPDEYQRAYGERVQVRCIQLDSPEAVNHARAALEAGKDFELVARQLSANRYTAERGGLLPPFSKYDNVPPLLRDTAFALKPGEVSSTIHENGAYFILRLEKRFPPSEVGLEYVKDDLRRRLRDRRVRERMDTLPAELFRAARIEIHDPLIRRQFQARYPDIRVRSANRP